MTFKFTVKQDEAMTLLSGDSTHILLDGGSRSGKTFLLTRAVVVRGLKAPESRHAIVRFRFNHVMASIVQDTFPKMMGLCFPELNYKIDKRDWFAWLPNDSQIWFAGLDDKERTEKVLGLEFSTLFLNEISQIPYSSRNIAVTRLAQKVMQKVNGRPDQLLKLRMLYDCNPPPKGHWSYLLFHKKIDPETKQQLPNPADYAAMQMNPQDNVENQAPGYIDTLKSLSTRLQKRFLLGEYADATPN